MTKNDQATSGRPKLAELREVKTVYQPAEDSRLLAEAVIEHGRVGQHQQLVDVGTGSGYVAARIHDETGASVVGCDINPDACRQAREMGVPVVRSDLLSAFQDNTVDILVCNPPYLPTPEGEEWDDWMEHALSGGVDGQRIVNRVIADAPRVLSQDGRVYLLVSSLTDPEAVAETARQAGFAVETIAEESHPFERLFVLALLLSRRR